MEQNNQIIFSKKDTATTKGVAVLLLCLHHLYWQDVSYPVVISGTNFHQLLVVWTKVCVTLFVMISGYGLTKSFSGGKRNYKQFTLEHLKKILVSYWWVYIPMLVLSFFFHFQGTPIVIYGGLNLGGIKNFLIDLFGIRAFFYTPTLNQTWWYIEAILVLYILFPFIYWLMNHGFSVLLVSVSAIPTVAIAFHLYWNPVSQTEREVYWILPFVLGMLLAKYDLLSKIKGVIVSHKVSSLVVIGFGTLCSMYLRAKLLLLPDSLYGFFIILFCIWMNVVLPEFVSKILGTFGKYSLNIFLMHSFLYYYFYPCASLVSKIPNAYGIRYVIFVVLSLCIAAVWDGVKKFLTEKKMA